jgi:hypothetical protein
MGRKVSKGFIIVVSYQKYIHGEVLLNVEPDRSLDVAGHFTFNSPSSLLLNEQHESYGHKDDVGVCFVLLVYFQVTRSTIATAISKIRSNTEKGSAKAL